MNVSVNNGFSFLNLDSDKDIELMVLHWDSLVSMMDDNVRETVHAELAPCTEVEFMKRYLEIASEDLVI